MWFRTLLQRARLCSLPLLKYAKISEFKPTDKLAGPFQREDCSPVYMYLDRNLRQSAVEEQ